MTFPLGRVIDCQSRLQRDFIEFARRWADVGEGWKDDRRRQFEQEHLSHLGPSLNRLSTSIQELSETIRKADRALEDRDHSKDD